MKNFKQDGNMLTFTAVTAIASGEGRLIGSTFVVAAHSAGDNSLCEGALRGVFELPKKSADTPAQGAAAYWDTANGHVTTSSGANKALIGVFTEAYLNGSTVANVNVLGLAAIAG